MSDSTAVHNSPIQSAPEKASTESGGFVVVPRSSLPTGRRGPKGRRLYDDMLTQAVAAHPNSIIASRGAPAHHATMVREAMETRLARPQNAALAQRGSFVVESHKVADDPARPGRNLVDVYLTFVEHAEREGASDGE